jgi:hypothetical protein
VSLKLYRRSRGGLEPTTVQESDWRRRLRSKRWKVKALENPERYAVRPWGAVAVLAFLLLATFLLVWVGYGSGFWTR